MLDRQNKIDLRKALQDKIQKDSLRTTTKTKYADDRFWKLTVDAVRTGNAIIRFLPAKDGEAFPYVTTHSHGFKGETNRWYIEACPNSIGEKCPVCEANSIAWGSGEAGVALARLRKRKLNYNSNILVMSDPACPENNGKVFLFRYGKKIFDKIKDLLSPLDVDIEEGANFRLKQHFVDGFPNFDKSFFDRPSSLGNEDYISEIQSKQYSLDELLDAKHFKGYAELDAKFKAGALPVAKKGESDIDFDSLTASGRRMTLVSEEDIPTMSGEDYFSRLDQQNQGN
jgi:gp32 DNA binding protein like